MSEEEWVDQFPCSSTSWVSEMLALWLVALSKGLSAPHIFLQLGGCIPSLSYFSNPWHILTWTHVCKSVAFTSSLGAAPDT